MFPQKNVVVAGDIFNPNQLNNLAMYEQNLPTFLQLFDSISSSFTLEMLQKTRFYKVLSKSPWNSYNKYFFGLISDMVNNYKTELDFLNDSEFNDIITNDIIDSDSTFVINI